MTTILDSVDRYISVPCNPFHNSSSRKVKPIWWDKNCEEASQVVCWSQRDWRRNKCLMDDLNAAERKADKIYDKAKDLCFKDFCSSLSPRTPLKKFWSTIKAFKHGNLNPTYAFSNQVNMDRVRDLISSICHPSCFLPSILKKDKSHPKEHWIHWQTFLYSFLTEDSHS